MANIFNVITALTTLILIQVTNVTPTNDNDVTIISWKGIKGLEVDTTLTPNVTKDCLRDSISRKVSNYPTNIAKWVLEQLKAKNTVEKIDKSTLNANVISMACETLEEIVYPQAAKSSTEKWHFILNLDHKLFQGFYTNKCGSTQCSQLRQPENSKCKQEYTSRTMIYLDMENERVASKLFKVPTRCSCKIMCSYY